MTSRGIDLLTLKSISIIREATAKHSNIAALWNMGKDSTAMLSLSRDAFLGDVPFPVIHLDNGIDFPETYDFRERVSDEWNLELIVAESKIRPELTGFSCCSFNKSEALKETLQQYNFDGVLVPIRRDKQVISANEKYFSSRNSDFTRDHKNKTAEIRENYYSLEDGGAHTKIQPILDWNELDIWNYTKLKNIPVNPLYFSVNGRRYRSLGCTHCAVPFKSNALDIDSIISELSTITEEVRTDREQDKEREYIMQRLRQFGYM